MVFFLSARSRSYSNQYVLMYCVLHLKRYQLKYYNSIIAGIFLTANIFESGPMPTP